MINQLIEDQDDEEDKYDREDRKWLTIFVF
jgi:hypothetical protein